ncbi:hypothetical protein [Planomonospora algeriensis]
MRDSGEGPVPRPASPIRRLRRTAARAGSFLASVRASRSALRRCYQAAVALSVLAVARSPGPG